MSDKELLKAKSAIYQLDYRELGILESWLRKRIQKMWPIERAKRKKEHDGSIKALPKGTMVVFTDSRHEFCGKVGEIVRHLGRNSNRTAVDFGKEIGVWHVPRVNLSSDINAGRISGLKTCRYVGRTLNKVLSNLK